MIEGREYEAIIHSILRMEIAFAAMKDDGNPHKTLDTAGLEKQHQEMLNRLSARHQARKSDSLDSSSSSSSLFLSRFAESKRYIESRVAELRYPADPVLLNSSLAEISAFISELEKLLAENSYFLASYEVRSSLKSVSDLKQNLENLSNELVPKKKVSFKNKSSTRKPFAQKEREIEKSGVVLSSSLPIRDSLGFRSRKNEILIRNFRGSSIGEFTLSDLESCEVRLIGTINALFVHRLKNCKIYTGPVIGSILIDGAEDCVFVLASHQIRIHCANRSDFYLRVRSRPIIEDSSGVRFAPYSLEYEGIDQELKAAGLEEETQNWVNVDDFRWLRAVQSPNWCLLPEDERVSRVTIDCDS